MKPRKVALARLAGLCLIGLLASAEANADFKSLKATWMAHNAGDVYSELTADWWLYTLGFPPEKDPTFLEDGPIDCKENQRGWIWFIPSPASFGPRFFSCEIERRALFFPLLTQIIFNSDLFPPEFFFTLDEKREFLDEVDDLFCGRAWLDGVQISRTEPTVIIQSPEFTYNSGYEGGPDVFGFLPGQVVDTESVASGRYVLLPPLSQGMHTLRIKAGLACDIDTLEPALLIVDNTYELTVKRRKHWSW